MADRPASRYDRVGRGYDQTRRADPYLTERIRHHLGPNAGGWYLDLGCGTYCGKHRPEMYLDPAVRAGVSTFSVLAERSEVETGCGRLA